jgi:hypothetical protein
MENKNQISLGDSISKELSAKLEWVSFCKDSLKSIEDINRETPWAGSEPEWWLEMMEVKRLLTKSMCRTNAGIRK